MSRITNIFNNLKYKKQKAFIPFVAAGDGGLDLSLDLLHLYAKNHADIIEIGVPFSDPMADGLVIAASYERAVKNGISLKDVFELVTKFRENNDEVAIVLMGYLNPIEIYGYDKFAIQCDKVGVDGVLIVDNPPEEAADLKLVLDAKQIDFIFLIAPTTTNERIQYLSSLISGFIYFVSLKGVTGSNNIDTDLVDKNLLRIKQYIDLPICVGFGIKDSHTAKLVSQNSDGVIVATSFIKFIEKYILNDKIDKNKMLASIDDLSKQISGVLK